MTKDILQEYTENEEQDTKPLETLLRKHTDLSKEAQKLKDQLDSVNKEITRYETNLIPEQMADMGIETATMDGYQVKLHKGTNVAIKKARQDDAHEWLRDNELGYLIKHELAVPFKRTEGNAVAELEQWLEENGYAYEKRSSVHPQTMKAQGSRLANDEGVTFPEDLFSVFDYRKAQIKVIDNNEEF